MRPGIAEGFVDQGEHLPDDLVAGGFPIVARYRTITGSGELDRGTVLGKILADGRFQISALAATDGSQEPDVILAEDVDLSEGDVQALVYTTGEFKRDRLVLGAGHTLETIEDVLRLRCILI